MFGEEEHGHAQTGVGLGQRFLEEHLHGEAQASSHRIPAVGIIRRDGELTEWDTHKKCT